MRWLIAQSISAVLALSTFAPSTEASFFCRRVLEPYSPSEAYLQDSILGRKRFYEGKLRSAIEDGDAAERLLDVPADTEGKIAYLSAMISVKSGYDLLVFDRTLKRLPREKVDAILADLWKDGESVKETGVLGALERFQALQMAYAAKEKGVRFSWTRGVRNRVQAHIVRKLASGPLIDGLSEIAQIRRPDLREKLALWLRRRRNARIAASEIALNLIPQIALNHISPVPLGYGAVSLPRGLRFFGGRKIPDAILEIAEREGFDAAAEAWLRQDPVLRTLAHTEAAVDIASRLYVVFSVGALGYLTYEHWDQVSTVFTLLGLNREDLKAAEDSLSCDDLRRRAFESWLESYNHFRDRPLDPNVAADAAILAEEHRLLDETKCEELRVYQ